MGLRARLARQPWPAVASGALLAAVAAVVYLPGLDNPFVYDDFRTIVTNGSLAASEDWRTLLRFDPTRPVTNLSFALDWAIWGPAPFGFHLTNLLLHMANVFLLVRLALKLTEDASGGAAAEIASARRMTAVGAVGLFAVHPLMSEAVIYVSARSEVLGTLWFLVAFLCGRRWLRDGLWLFWLGTVAAWALWLATRETGVMLPVLLLAYHRLLNGAGTMRTQRRRARLLVGPLLAAALLAAALRVWLFIAVEHRGAPAVSWIDAFQVLDVVRHYLALLVFPVGQAIFHDTARSGMAVASGILTVGTLAVLAFQLRKAAPLVTFGLIWFMALLVPSLVLPMIGPADSMAEHRLYLASVGLFVAAGAGVGRLAGTAADTGLTRRLLGLAGVAVALSLSTRTVVRTLVWSDPVALWQEASTLSPAHPVPRTVLGESLHDAGRHGEAVDAFEAAIALQPDREVLYVKATLCLGELRRFDDAAALVERLRRRNPDTYAADEASGVLAYLRADLAEARAAFARALARNPDNVTTLLWLAVTEEDLGRNYAEAARLCQRVQRLAGPQPDSVACVERNTQRAEGGR